MAPESKSQTMTSPPSIRTGFQLFALPPSASLGTRTSSGEYRYQPFSAATEALMRASSRLAPAPSPSFSFPAKTPTIKTGVRDLRPVSERMRATGDSKPSRAHNLLRSRVGCLNSNILEMSR